TAFQTLGGTKGILDGFFRNLMDVVERQHGRVGRIEALELLNSLMTSSGKSPRPRNELVDVPFRDRDLRSRFLKLLGDERVIRQDRRSGQTIVEIRHDFLVKRILDTYQTEIQRNPEYGRFKSALATLQLCLEWDQHLSKEQYENLARYVGRIDWDGG